MLRRSEDEGKRSPRATVAPSVRQAVGGRGRPETSWKARHCCARSRRYVGGAGSTQDCGTNPPQSSADEDGRNPAGSNSATASLFTLVFRTTTPEVIQGRRPRRQPVVGHRVPSSRKGLHHPHSASSRSPRRHRRVVEFESPKVGRGQRPNPRRSPRCVRTTASGPEVGARPGSGSVTRLRLRSRTRSRLKAPTPPGNAFRHGNTRRTGVEVRQAGPLFKPCRSPSRSPGGALQARQRPESLQPRVGQLTSFRARTCRPFNPAAP